MPALPVNLLVILYPLSVVFSWLCGLLGAKAKSFLHRSTELPCTGKRPRGQDFDAPTTPQHKKGKPSTLLDGWEANMQPLETTASLDIPDLLYRSKYRMDGQYPIRKLDQELVAKAPWIPYVFI
ncbi:MAG: hypothetical protein J3Q66DRAFT_359431 [Benniella sp.]|nr:MAG: hypothetical protein J3Q66DRAFT_359431 [Benniella sp.]